MRIAQVAPLYESVPPRLYGGTERVVSWLTEELVRLGHEVTLFASGDSVTNAHLVPASCRALRLDRESIDPLAHHVLMVEQVFSAAANFDIIHFHLDFLHFPLSRRAEVACVTTLHGRLDISDLVPLYQHFRELPLVSISDAQRAPLPWVNWQGTVHHGMPRTSLTLGGVGGGDGRYLAFLGRVSPEKGLDHAIEIAKRCGMLLKVAAKIDRADQAYFETEIRRMLDEPSVEFVGEIGNDEKAAFLGEAAALLFPINWPEPFGIVMIEAMACGTPVIAYPCGSVPEIITNRVTGFVVPDIDRAVEAVGKLGEIDRKECRKHFELNFSDERMAREYLGIYERLVRGKSPALTVEDGVLSWTDLASPSSTT